MASVVICTALLASGFTLIFVGIYLAVADPYSDKGKGKVRR